MRYAVVIEQGETSYGAYVPDLPGCIAVGETLDEVRELINEAVQFHLEGLREDGEPIPLPRSILEYVEAENRSSLARPTPSAICLSVAQFIQQSLQAS